LAQIAGRTTQLVRILVDEASLSAVLAGTRWAVVVAMCGRLRIAALTKGRCGHFVSVGGVPAHAGRPRTRKEFVE
jgi:hypothetical protein